MYGFYTHGPETMVCQHIADWSRQVLTYLDDLTERGVPQDRLAGWRDRFTALEAEAFTLLNPWQWGVQGMGGVARLLDQAHGALADFTGMLKEPPDSPADEPEPVAGGDEPAAAPEGEPVQREAELPEGDGEPVESEGAVAESNSTAQRRPGDRGPLPRPEIRPVPIGGHQLPPLPYPYEALEPHIDRQTMRIHHDRHHRSYVEGLNKAERMMAEARRSGDFDLITHWEREAAFNGAGHYLHTVFWNIMAPRAGGQPTGPVAEQIQRDFGSFEQFKTHFSRAAEKVEGSGWALWVWSPRANRTEILTAEKHQNLTQWESIPLLVLDVWEHSYYLKYQNDRKAYIEAWWNVVNWPEVARRYERARTLTWQPL